MQRGEGAFFTSFSLKILGSRVFLKNENLHRHPSFVLQLFRTFKISHLLRTDHSWTSSYKPSPSSTLRPYQEACIQACLNSIREGKRRLGVSLATGSGKTLIFSSLIQKINPIQANATQTLILAHRRELVEQAFQQCRLLYPEKTIDIEMANIHASGLADITIASVPTIVSHERLKKFDPRRFKLILIDEVHHAASASYIRILEHFSALNSESEIIVIGLSATITRLDGLKLGVAIDHIAYHQDLTDLIKEKWLSDIFFTTLTTNPDLSKVKSDEFENFKKKSLSNITNLRPTNDICNLANQLLCFVNQLETLIGIDTIRAYGDEKKFIRENLQKIDMNNRPFICLWACNRWLNIRIDVVRAFISALLGAFIVLNINNLDSSLADNIENDRFKVETMHEEDLFLMDAPFPDSCRPFLMELLEDITSTILEISKPLLKKHIIRSLGNDFSAEYLLKGCAFPPKSMEDLFQIIQKFWTTIFKELFKSHAYDEKLSTMLKTNCFDEIHFCILNVSSWITDRLGPREILHNM
ncbi:hypothetical protein PCK1_000718 [Pneumocystis canis]|nr:hypothetical protein PCK1_000718 [Pneumocystis canis]